MKALIIASLLFATPALAQEPVSPSVPSKTRTELVLAVAKSVDAQLDAATESCQVFLEENPSAQMTLMVESAVAVAGSSGTLLGTMIALNRMDDTVSLSNTARRCRALLNSPHR